MRTISGGEAAVLADTDFRVDLRVKVENGSGTMKDMSSWVEKVTLDTSLDHAAAQATIDFRRDSASTISLSPFRTDSALNVLDDAVTYSPLLDLGREFTIEVATTASGVLPSAGDWKMVFKGYTDLVQFEHSPVIITGRDEAGILVDRLIETETDYPEASLQDAIQRVLDETLGSGVVTLHVPTDPAYTVNPYKQQRQSLMDAITALAQLRGWDVRYKWDDASSSFKLTLYDPLRTGPPTLFTFGPSRYIDVTGLAIDRTDVRNVVTVNYFDAVRKARLNQTATNATSIANYGRRTMLIQEADDSPIDSWTEAAFMASNAVFDLADPPAEQEIEMHLWWPAEINDFYAFAPNGVHYNIEQDWAVVGVRHELSIDKHRTYLTVRGAPSSGYLLWRVRAASGQTVPLDTPPALPNFREVERTETQVVYGWDTVGAVQEIWVYLSTPPQPISSDPWAALAGAPTVRLTPDTTEYTVTIPAAGLVTYGRAVPIDAAGKLGKFWDFTTQGTAINLLQRATVLTTNATTVVARVAVANPVAGSDVTVAYTSGLAVAPASGQTILEASVGADIATTGYVDFTITRPAFGTGSGRVTFTAMSAGRVSDTDSIDVPAVEKTSFGPSLTITPTPGPSSYSIAWSGDGVTVSIDGGSYSAPSTSPITVTRNPANGADKIYAFSAVKDGQTVTDSVVIPAIGAVDTVGPSLTVTPTPGPSSYSVAWSGTGTVTVAIDGGSYSTPSASPITVARNAANGADKVYSFRAVSGSQTVTDSVVIPAIGAVDTNTVTPDLTVTPSAPTANTQTFTATASNPSGGAAPTITYDVIGCTAAGGTITSAGNPHTYSSAVVVDRPAWDTTAQATISFKATIASNGSETISRTVLNQVRDTQALAARILRVSETATQVVVRVEVISPNAGAAVTVAYDAGGLTVSPASGGTLTSTTSFGTTAHIDYTITRPAYTDTPRRVTFTASASGFTDATDGYDVVPLSRDLAVNKIVATEINVSSLSAIAAELGTVTVTEGTSGITMYVSATNCGSLHAASGGTVPHAWSRVEISAQSTKAKVQVGDASFTGLEGSIPPGGSAGAVVIGTDSATPTGKCDIQLRGQVLLGDAGNYVGFMGATPIPRPTVTGSRGGNAALASLLTQLALLGLITDSST